MRALQTHDVFKAMKIVNALGVKEEVKRLALAMQNGKKMSQNEVGVEFLLTIIGNAGNEEVEASIYEFLSGILEIPTENISVMDPMDLIEEIKKLSAYISKEKWKAFFGSVASMIR